MAVLASWSAAVWLLLTWTVTAEQLIFGAVLAVLVGLALAPFSPGGVVAPWSLLRPRRLGALLTLAGYAVARIVAANIGLARRIWTPSLPLRSGMVVVPTRARTDGELAAVGIVTSLIVDNQIVDLDRGARELQYHAVAVPRGDRVEAINGPVERLAARIRRA